MDPLAGGVVVVETGVWVDFFRGIRNPQTEWVLQALGASTLVTLDLILCEVLQGVPKNANYQNVRNTMLDLAVCNSGGERMALASAENYRTLRAKGITIRTTIDCIIATYCIRNGFSLLHNDRDFDPFEKHLGLRVIRPDGSKIQ